MVLGTIVLIIIAHHAMVLLHEWSHATVAYSFGLKQSPFDIIYGNWTLLDADENINYGRLLNSGQPWIASLIAASALFMNVVLFLASRWMLTRQWRRKHVWSVLAWYWFALFNIAELYSYIPLRTFSKSGDVGHFVAGLGISPWVVLVIGTPLIIYALAKLLMKDLLYVVESCLPASGAVRVGYVIISVAVVFGFYGSAPAFYYGLDNPAAWGTYLSAVLWIGATICLLMMYRGIARRVP